MKLKVKITRKIFLAEETGFGVFKVSVIGERESRIIVGELFDVREGDFLEIEGDEIYHPRFGQQIRVSRFQSILPQDSEGMIKYLSSGRIKGVGKKTAQKIVDWFGDLTFNILEKQPERLREIPRIRKSVVEAVRNNFQDNRLFRDLTVKLAPFGIGSETIFKIVREFGQNSIMLLESNPYLLIETVKGISFRIADTIARVFGIQMNDSNRIRAGIYFVLSQIEQQRGDLYLEENELVVRTRFLLDVDEQDIHTQLEHMLIRRELIKDEIPDNVIVTLNNFAMEKEVARYLARLSKVPSPSKEMKTNSKWIPERITSELTEEQIRAVKSTFFSRIVIITGGPGTGKTTIIKAIIELFKEDKKKVFIAAPTGRAAKRVEESTGYQASTIHRLLKINPETGKFIHNEGNLLQADVIIIDEFSMVDIFIFYSLLRALTRDTQLIIIGDKDQLPSVGPGNVLRTLIDCSYFTLVSLSRNFRQSKDSLIVENAYRINKGKSLILPAYSEGLDFVFIRVKNGNHALEKVLGVIKYYSPEYEFNSMNLQILAPMYRGEAGIDHLNAVIQETFNPNQILFTRDKVGYKRFDKVMQLKNNYDKEVFNGDQGIVIDFNTTNRCLQVDFDGYTVEYSNEELDELTLSYAISVHKSQGSEYDIVVMIMLPSQSVVVNRELFYTGVTRTRKRFILLSNEETIQQASANSAPSIRRTLLPFRLKEVF